MEPTPQSLARTYSDRVYPDPWEKVEDYQRVQGYTAEHPNAGRTAVGNALELPPSRVRGWMGDVKPDPVHGVHTASAYGWLDPEPGSDMAGALVELLAHVLAGGSINETFVPAVSPGRRVDIETIYDAFEAVGVDAQTRHVDTDGRATEVYPTADASVLGRCLVAMGAPRGTKTELSAVPTVVWESPAPIRRRFVEIYVAHRGAHFETKATTRITEERPESYLKDLQKLITETVDGEVSFGVTGLTISAVAARDLGVS
ncbi:hypothetical protein [Halorubrum aethiopicum]|uniref:hypothetical protein n=1 Tax=Halorubrum aethiopicum TaxID=1758255 RepID=UPI00082988E9|nr:hypothetical protein [Halorubrum aethiopicum]